MAKKKTAVRRTEAYEQTQKKKAQRARLMTFGIVVAVYALLFPLYRIGDYALCGALSWLLSRVVGVLAEALDFRSSDKKQEDEIKRIVITGNTQADELIARGQEMILEIRKENDLNPDPILSDRMEALESVSIRILKAVQDKPERASSIRRFMDYYLPTTLKMLTNYRMMDEKQLTGEGALHARNRIEQGVLSVITACEKLLNDLYREDYLDVNTDLDVLRQMLKRDGLTDGDLTVDSAYSAAYVYEGEDEGNDRT